MPSPLLRRLGVCLPSGRIPQNDTCVRAGHQSYNESNHERADSRGILAGQGEGQFALEVFLNVGPNYDMSRVQRVPH